MAGSGNTCVTVVLEAVGAVVVVVVVAAAAEVTAAAVAVSRA